MEPLLIVILVGVAAWSAAVAVREFRRQAERRRMDERLRKKGGDDAAQVAA